MRFGIKSFSQSRRDSHLVLCPQHLSAHTAHVTNRSSDLEKSAETIPWTPRSQPFLRILPAVILKLVVLVIYKLFWTRAAWFTVGSHTKHKRLKIFGKNSLTLLLKELSRWKLWYGCDICLQATETWYMVSTSFWRYDTAYKTPETTGRQTPFLFNILRAQMKSQLAAESKALSENY